MDPDKLLGWTVETSKRRAHLIGQTEIVVGAKTPGVVTVRFSLCGTTGHSGTVSRIPQSTTCARCSAAAFALARRDALPDIEVEP